MKTTTLKKSLIAGLLLISSMAYANDGKTDSNSAYLNVKVTALENKMVRMSFQKLQDEKVNIKIYDQSGTRVYDEKITDKTSVLKKYDLSKFPAGTYAFEVSNDVYLMKRKIELK